LSLSRFIGHVQATSVAFFEKFKWKATEVACTNVQNLLFFKEDKSSKPTLNIYLWFY